MRPRACTLARTCVHACEHVRSPSYPDVPRPLCSLRAPLCVLPPYKSAHFYLHCRHMCRAARLAAKCRLSLSPPPPPCTASRCAVPPRVPARAMSALSSNIRVISQPIRVAEPACVLRRACAGAVAAGDAGVGGGAAGAVAGGPGAPRHPVRPLLVPLRATGPPPPPLSRTPPAPRDTPIVHAMVHQGKVSVPSRR
jgi:hypothetical protein